MRADSARSEWISNGIERARNPMPISQSPYHSNGDRTRSASRPSCRAPMPRANRNEATTAAVASVEFPQTWENRLNQMTS